MFIDWCNIFLFRGISWQKIGGSCLLILALPLSVLASATTSASSTPTTSSNTISATTTGPIGKASWYDYKTGFFAASTIYPIGQKVRVHHLATGKSVDVTINDYGPDPKIHPDRVIDLQKEAFIKLATLGTGVITVRLEPITATSSSKPIIASSSASSSPAKTKSDFKNLTITNKEVTSAIILDANNNQILWQKNAQQILPIASLTKMVAIKTFLDTKPNLNKTVTYKLADEQKLTKYCSLEEASLVKLKDQDQIKIKDLVYSALVGSANNAVESLVRISGLSRVDFIKKMNSNAKKWGAVNTKFVEPTGLSTDNVSTAKDYALILKTVSQDANIKKISTTAVYKFTTINTKKTHTIKNTNKLLRDGQFDLQSSKTGYLNEAGHCLAMAAQNKTTKQKFIVVTLGSASWSKSYQTASQILTTALN